MKHLIIFILVCLVLVTLPAYAFDGDEADVWPCFFGTDNGGPDNGYMSFYDQDANAFQAPRLIDNDLLDAQWTPQRCGIGNDTSGKYNVSFIEATGNDIEIWESPDDGWQDDAGAWAMTDNDAADNWFEIDVETRQNYVWAVGTPTFAAYINLFAGVPAWVVGGATLAGPTFSISLDNTLFGSIQCAYISAGNLRYSYIKPNFGNVTSLIRNTRDYPQIIVDKSSTNWVFATDGNTLYVEMGLIQPGAPAWSQNTQVYTATGLLESYYHAAWLAADDTIHIVLVDFVGGVANQTRLRYLRRTPNGWSAAITLLTVDSAAPATVDIQWPQITVGPNKSIFIHYILDTDYTNPAAGGDLQGFHLDLEDYADYVTPATWTQYTNIDQSADNIIWCVARDSEIVYQDI